MDADPSAAQKIAAIGFLDHFSYFESRTGLVLPDDLETLFGNNLLLAIDSGGLTAGAVQAGDLSSLNLGLRFTADPTELGALYDKVVRLIQDSGGAQMPLAKVAAADGMVIASNDGYGAQLGAHDRDLGRPEAFRSVVDDAASKELVLSFNWDAVEAQVVDALRNEPGPGPSQQVVDTLEALRAVGITSETDGAYTVSTLRVSSTTDPASSSTLSLRLFQSGCAALSSATTACAPSRWPAVTAQPRWLGARRASGTCPGVVGRPRRGPRGGPAAPPG